MKQFSIQAAFASGWTQFMRRPWYLFFLSLAIIALSVLTSTRGVTSILSYILFGGYLALLLRHYADQHVQFDDLFDIDRRWIYFVFLAVIKTVLIMLGLVCFVIPGIYLAVRWAFAELLVIDKGMRPLEALKASSELTAGVRWKLFWFGIVCILAMLVGVVVFIVGMFAAGVIVQLASIHVYRSLQRTPEQPPGTPEAGSVIAS